MRLAIQKSNAKTQEERTMIHAEKTIIAQTYRGTCHAQKPCRRGSGGAMAEAEEATRAA